MEEGGKAGGEADGRNSDTIAGRVSVPVRRHRERRPGSVRQRIFPDGSAPVRPPRIRVKFVRRSLDRNYFRLPRLQNQ